MYGFPSGVTAPEGAQKLVDVCKGTWAVIEDKESELLNAHNRAVESYTAAVEELNEMGVHFNNAGKFPVFTPGVKETVCDPSARAGGRSAETAELSALTNAVRQPIEQGDPRGESASRSTGGLWWGGFPYVSEPLNAR
jgi:hypothetical protein